MTLITTFSSTRFFFVQYQCSDFKFSFVPLSLMDPKQWVLDMELKLFYAKIENFQGDASNVESRHQNSLTMQTIYCAVYLLWYLEGAIMACQYWPSNFLIVLMKMTWNNRRKYSKTLELKHKYLYTWMYYGKTLNNNALLYIKALPLGWKYFRPFTYMKW